MIFVANIMSEDIMTRSKDEADSEAAIDSYVEHLQRKYLNDKNKSSTESSQLQQHSDITDFSPTEIVTCSPASSLTASEKQHYKRAMAELKNLLKLGETKLEKSVFEYEAALHKNPQADVPPLHLDRSVSQEDWRDSETTLTQSVTLPTLSSGMSASTNDKARKSVRISLEPTTFLESEFSTGIDGPFQGPGILRPSRDSKKFESTDVKIIHGELINIHMKLNQKSQALAMYQSELEEREEILEERELEVTEREQRLELNQASVDKAKEVMSRLQGVEVKVEEKFHLLRECHAAEMEKLNANLSEKTREYKRIKNSFDVLKNQNDELKTQESELSSMNEKLRIQNQKLKKRLENLQRKQEFNACRQPAYTQVLGDRTNQSGSSDKPSSAVTEKSIDKSAKVWSNSVDALSVSLDWINDVHLKPSSGRINSQQVGKEMTIDKCLKILPMLVDVVRYLPLCHNKHHLPFLRFIYWSLHQLEDSHHNTLLSSTARRIGEELIKPSSVRLASENDSFSSSLFTQSISSSCPVIENKVKPHVFFHSNNPEIRIVSSLIIIKTLHQVDILAQVFQQLKKDLKVESNRGFFIDYSATQALLPYLTYKTNKSLLGSAVDLMLQMSMESGYLPAFLDQCSCESWFRAVSSAVRAVVQNNDVASLEKLSVILQKLSKIKSNKKYFETFSLGRSLQEYHRACDPSSTFLSLNLRSILFNLNLIKSS